MSITNNLDSNRTVSYTYDALNRISTAGTPMWTLNYNPPSLAGTDQYGNLRNVTATGAATGLSMSVDSNTNRLTNVGATPISYDAAGNITNDGVTQYTYDAEGRQASENGGNFVYDGLGRRVRKPNASLQWYGAGSDVLYQTDVSGNNGIDYIFMGGRRLASYTESTSAINHYFQDALGSTRLVVASNSNSACYDADFYPYGGESVVTATCAPPYKFTGMMRDGTGDDHTQYRQYMSNFGRWASPDPLAGDVTNPQSLNRYAYVRNNPTNFVDPLGLDPAGQICIEQGTVYAQCFSNPYDASLPNCVASGSEGCILLPPIFIPGGNGGGGGGGGGGGSSDGGGGSQTTEGDAFRLKLPCLDQMAIDNIKVGLLALLNKTFGTNKQLSDVTFSTAPNGTMTLSVGSPLNPNDPSSTPAFPVSQVPQHAGVPHAHPDFGSDIRVPGPLGQNAGPADWGHVVYNTATRNLMIQNAQVHGDIGGGLSGSHVIQWLLREQLLQHNVGLHNCTVKFTGFDGF
jgi:RHS repeat-associated protein